MPPEGKPALLLLGAEGQLGQEVRCLAAVQGLTLTALNRGQVDITRPHQVREAVGGGFAAVINAAAYTAVDRAESEPERAYAVNRDGAGHVASLLGHDAQIVGRDGVPRPARRAVAGRAQRLVRPAELQQHGRPGRKRA